MSGSLKVRRLEEMAQLNAFSPKGLEVPFEFQKGRWHLKFPRMKRFVEEGRAEWEKEVIQLSIKEKYRHL